MNEEDEALFGIDKLNIPRSDIPAVTHVDYSARIQTVHSETNPAFHALLTAFKRLTGCPVLVIQFQCSWRTDCIDAGRRLSVFYGSGIEVGLLAIVFCARTPRTWL